MSPESASVAWPYASWMCIMFSLPWSCAGCPLSPVQISPLSPLLFTYVTTNQPPNPFGPSLNTISSWQPSLSTGTPVFLSTPSTMPSCFETLSKLVNAWNLLPAPQTRFELYEGKDCVVCSPPISPRPSMVLGTWKLQHLGWLSGMNEWMKTWWGGGWCVVYTINTVVLLQGTAETRVTRERFLE